MIRLFWILFGGILLQNAAGIQMLGVLPLQTQNLRSLLVMDGGLILSGNYAGEKIIWFDLESQTERILWESSRHPATALSLNTEASHVAYITNEMVQILDLASLETQDFFIPLEDEDVPTTLAWYGDQIALGTVDNRRLILDANSGQLIQEDFLADKQRVNQLLWLETGQLLSGHSDGTLQLEDHIWVGHSRRVTALASFGNWIASAGADRRVHLWKRDDQRQVFSFEASVGSLSFSPDGSLLLGGGASLHIWDVVTGEKVYEGFHSSPQVSALNAAFSKNGPFIFAGKGRVSVWGLEAGELKIETLQDDRLAAGAELYQRNACYGCHFDYPSGAPTLYGLGNLAGARIEGMSAEDYIYQGIVDPDAYVPRGYPRGIHPEYYGERLSSEQIWLLVEYILSLNEKDNSAE